MVTCFWRSAIFSLFKTVIHDSYYTPGSNGLLCFFLEFIFCIYKMLNEYNSSSMTSTQMKHGLLAYSFEITCATKPSVSPSNTGSPIIYFAMGLSGGTHPFVELYKILLSLCLMPEVWRYVFLSLPYILCYLSPTKIAQCMHSISLQKWAVVGGGKYSACSDS